MDKMKSIIKHALLALLICLSNSNISSANDESVIKIAMLHLELKYADLEHNAALIESGIELAAQKGADWIMTPELSLTGYRFDLKIGTDWISSGPDKYVKRVQLFNTLFVIDPSGEIIGRHKKINIIPISESWSSAGTKATLVNVGHHKVGLLICADAWPNKHAQNLKEQGADIILSDQSVWCRIKVVVFYHITHRLLTL